MARGDRSIADGVLLQLAENLSSQPERVTVVEQHDNDDPGLFVAAEECGLSNGFMVHKL